MDSQFLIYQNQEGDIKIDVRFQDETIWLSLDQMATLFSRDKSTISRHILKTFLKKENYTETQLLQILQQLPPMVKTIR